MEPNVRLRPITTYVSHLTDGRYTSPSLLQSGVGQRQVNVNGRPLWIRPQHFPKGKVLSWLGRAIKSYLLTPGQESWYWPYLPPVKRIEKRLRMLYSCVHTELPVWMQRIIASLTNTTFNLLYIHIRCELESLNYKDYNRITGVARARRAKRRRAKALKRRGKRPPNPPVFLEDFPSHEETRDKQSRDETISDLRHYIEGNFNPENLPRPSTPSRRNTGLEINLVIREETDAEREARKLNPPPIHKEDWSYNDTIRRFTDEPDTFVRREVDLSNLSAAGYGSIRMAHFNELEGQFDDPIDYIVFEQCPDCLAVNGTCDACLSQFM